MEPTTPKLVVRQTFLDKRSETAASVPVDRLPEAVSTAAAASGSGRLHMEKRPALTASEVAAGLSGSALFISGAAMQVRCNASLLVHHLTDRIMNAFRHSCCDVCCACMQLLQWSNMLARDAHNRFVVLDKYTYITAWADPSIHFFHGSWSLQSNEALIIKACCDPANNRVQRLQSVGLLGFGKLCQNPAHVLCLLLSMQVTPPDCPCWNFQLNNWWMESMDSDNFQVHVNKRSAVIGPDGKSVYIVVSFHDQQLIGVSYVETAHHTHGTMAWRWVLAQEFPASQCEVVPLNKIATLLSPWCVPASCSALAAFSTVHLK